jgi:hypothetical protein
MKKVAPQRFNLFALPVIVTTIMPPPAYAEPSCAGKFDTTVLQSLPRPMSVSFDVGLTSAANPDLMQRLVAGLENAGVTVAGNGGGNTQLSLTFSITPSHSDGAQLPTKTYSDFRWVSGETAPDAGQWNIRGATMSVSAEASDVATQTLAWIGTLSCTIMVADPNVFAEDLGNMIGRTLKAVGQH